MHRYIHPLLAFAIAFGAIACQTGTPGGRSRIFRNAVLILATMAAAGFLLIRECAFGGGMGAMYKTCKCLGVEWELYDARPADGPRKTMCLGIVQSTTCYRFDGGPVVECHP